MCENFSFIQAIGETGADWDVFHIPRISSQGISPRYSRVCTQIINVVGYNTMVEFVLAKNQTLAT